MWIFYCERKIVVSCVITPKTAKLDSNSTVTRNFLIIRQKLFEIFDRAAVLKMRGAGVK